MSIKSVLMFGILVLFFPIRAANAGEIAGKVDGPNCYNRALLQAGLIEELRYVSFKEFKYYLEKEFTVISFEELQKRDDLAENHIVILYNGSLPESHAAYVKGILNGTVTLIEKPDYTKKSNTRTRETTWAEIQKEHGEYFISKKKKSDLFEKDDEKSDVLETNIKILNRYVYGKFLNLEELLLLKKVAVALNAIAVKSSNEIISINIQSMMEFIDGTIPKFESQSAFTGLLYEIIERKTAEKALSELKEVYNLVGITL